MEVRRILEEFSAEVPKGSPMLSEAYGIMLFKCPIVHCTRFYHGFASRQQRDKHLGQHERTHKCTHEGCDYMELGFPTESELRRHIELCHRVLHEEPTFPNVQRVNLSKALNNAIDRDDVQAVRDICSEISVCPLRETGFILRAIKRRSISTALVLVELLGTDVEMNHVDSKGRTALHEAVQIRNDNLFDRVLDTGIEVDVRDCEGFTPYWRALYQGYFHAIRSLMDHAAIEPIPEKVLQAYQIYYKGMKEVAAAGIDDILKAQFSNFVNVSQSCLGRRFNQRISDDLIRIIEKAASNKHESTVKLILELAHALDLQRRYHGLLKKKLHHGIQAMTTFLLQHYREGKPEIGKNGKTYGNTLANAARKDDSAAVMRLIKDGAHIDYATPQLAYNALGAASSQGNLSMVSLLLEQGADVNAKGGYSGNALYLACRGNHITVVDLLLERGADVNARLSNGETALIKASYGSRLDTFQRLIEKGPDINLQDKHGNTALHMASKNVSNKIVAILVQEGANVDLQNEDGQTALFSASQNGYKEIVKTLLQGGADVNLQNIDGQTALFSASHNGYNEFVETLVQKGADVHLQSKYRQTALFVAFKRDKREVVDVLVKAEVDIEVKDSNQLTALWQAAEKGWEDIVQILIDRGADVNVQNVSGETALFVAAQGGHVGVVRILLAGGAKDLEAALGTAFMYKHVDVLQALLLQASRRQQRLAVQVFRKDKTYVSTLGGPYEVALSSACLFGMEESVKVLLEVGAQLPIPAGMYDRALGLIGSRKYLLDPEYEAIAKLLRERRALAATQDLDDLNYFNWN